ncbi:MAG TPA: hypothetical protein VFF06_27580 [Polyangia bacterium]|nr:hypothetical protein [Polyangia bacterium]
MSRFTALAFTSALALAPLGCAAPKPQVKAPVAQLQPAPATQLQSAPDASGVWDWMFRSTDDQGDMRVEQEEWHLLQRGSRVEGYYDRAVTMMSTDERLFRCNQKLGFTKVTRVRVTGQLEGDHILLREIGFEAKPGPCDDGARNLVEYRGVLHSGTLALRWGPEAGQTLVRRADGNHAPLAKAEEFGGAPDEGDATRASSTVSAAVDGTWEWELRSIDAEGDERTEREEWHLTETADGIRGYYDRVVRRIRGDGSGFPCNGEAKYETSTRYTVVGQRFGEKLMLTEVDYKAEPSRCDNALRRLDSYQGHVADPDSLVLSWGPGNQLLHRKK